MRFLFLTSPPQIRKGDKSLIIDLAAALVDDGHHVDLVAIEWTAPPGGAPRIIEDNFGIRVLAVPPFELSWGGALLKKLSKWVWSGVPATASAREVFDVDDYDAVVGFTPCVTIGRLLDWARRNRSAARILFIFDFFPIHHREIRLVPGGPIFHLAKWRETALMRSFDTIVCNLPSNVAYLKHHYRVRTGQTLLSTPLWTDGFRPPVDTTREEMRWRNGLPLERKIAVFGGQITEGRGIEMMLEAASIGAGKGDGLVYLFIGSGRLAHLAEQRASQPDANVIYLPSVPRDDYLALLSACDIGMISTVPGVSSHSFPTKLLEYVRVGLPVVAAVEPGSDFNKIIERYKLGRISGVGDATAFQAALAGVAGDEALKAWIKDATWRCLTEFLDVKLTRQMLVDAARCGKGTAAKSKEPERRASSRETVY